MIASIMSTYCVRTCCPGWIHSLHLCHTSTQSEPGLALLQVQYSGDGSRLVSRGEDSSLCVYEAPQGYLPTKMLSAMPDACKVGGASGTLQLHALAVDDLAHSAATTCCKHPPWQGRWPCKATVSMCGVAGQVDYCTELCMPCSSWQAAQHLVIRICTSCCPADLHGPQPRWPVPGERGPRPRVQPLLTHHLPGGRCAQCSGQQCMSGRH